MLLAPSVRGSFTLFASLDCAHPLNSPAHLAFTSAMQVALQLTVQVQTKECIAKLTDATTQKALPTPKP
jgi:hypothetical protein